VVERSLAFGLDRWKMLRLIESVIGRRMRARFRRLLGTAGDLSARVLARLSKYKAYSPH